ncbi:MAG: hypothetical protein Q8K96_06710 [Rubrivivax sp.]|nr:hypothetical protein [Rubrivivax sp.]
MNIQSLLTRLRRAPAAPLPALPAPDTELGPDGAAQPDRPLGCGWFDSSHELQRGLVVREYATADTLAGELPLANWLELHLAGWRGAVPALGSAQGRQW